MHCMLQHALHASKLKLNFQTPYFGVFLMDPRIEKKNEALQNRLSNEPNRQGVGEERRCKVRRFVPV